MLSSQQFPDLISLPLRNVLWGWPRFSFWNTLALAFIIPYLPGLPLPTCKGWCCSGLQLPSASVWHPHYFLLPNLEKTLESPMDCKEIKPVNPKGNQSWIFIGRTDAEAEAPILWPADVKSQLIGKDPNAGQGWKLKAKGTAEDEMVR